MNSRYPYQPFDKPVRPPPEANAGDVCLRFDAKWIPYILGCLGALLAEQTWTGEIDRATGEARNLMTTFIKAMACMENVNNGVEMEDCMGCCIRVHDGKLQVFSCGEWQDVDGGNISDIAMGSGQPGAGSPQPPGGQCENFIGKVLFFGRYLLPVPVSAGDTFQVTNAFGASTDYIVDTPDWRCPDGDVYIAGGCVNGTEISGAGDPYPAAPHASLVAFDGTNYYDCSAAAKGLAANFTIPSGVSNANLVFLINSAGPAGAGDCTFDVRVCKRPEPVAPDLILTQAGGSLSRSGIHFHWTCPTSADRTIHEATGKCWIVSNVVVTSGGGYTGGGSVRCDGSSGPLSDFVGECILSHTATGSGILGTPIDITFDAVVCS